MWAGKSGNKRWDFVESGNKRWDFVESGNKRWDFVDVGGIGVHIPTKWYINTAIISAQTVLLPMS